jgi:mannosyltransferase
MLLALALRWPGLGTTNLWLDEANSWLLAKYPLSELLANIRASPGSPLYFLLLKLWVQIFGDSERALRALSLAMSVALVPATYALGVHTLSRRAALIGTLLLALSPLQLYYAQEARVYMQLALVATACLTAYAAWRPAVGVLDAVSPDTPGPRPRRPLAALTAYVVCAVLAVYTLNLAVMLLLAINLDVAIDALRAARAPMGAASATGTGPARDAGRGLPLAMRRRLATWLVAQVIVVAACLPLVLTVDVHTAVSTQAWRRALGVSDAFRGLFDFFASSIHGGYIYPWDLYHAVVDGWERRAVWVRVFAYPLTLLAVLTALSYPPRSSRTGSARVLYLALFLPVLAGAAISASRELSLPRYFLFTTPCLYLLIGAGIARMGAWLRFVVLAILVTTMGIGVHTYRSVSARDSDYRPVARRLAADAEPHDVILIQPPEMGVPLSYYLRAGAGGRETPIVGLAAGAPLAGALVPAPAVRTWVVLDYRSGAFTAEADTLARAVGGHVASDSVETPGRSGVRMLVVDSMRPKS